MFDPKENLKNEFKKEFGHPLNVRQLWVISKLAKFVRLRARNNAAFNNAMNQIFPHARFETVTKTRKVVRPGDSPTYPGLKITTKELHLDLIPEVSLHRPAESFDGGEAEEGGED